MPAYSRVPHRGPRTQWWERLGSTVAGEESESAGAGKEEMHRGSGLRFEFGADQVAQ